MAFQETVDRRERGVAERVRLARRLEQAHHRRQDADAGEEGDQHAEAGDQSELGQALVVGRQERQETGRGGERRQRQRRAGAPAGMQERLAHAVDLVPLGAVADAVLEAEIDPEPDEQHREINRDQIERPDQQHAERRRQRQPDDQTDDHGEDDAEPAQREPQDAQHDRDGHHGVERGVLLDGGEFIVVHRHRTGQAHARLIIRRQMKIGGGLANGVARFEPRLQLRIVEHRHDFQEPQQIDGLGLLAADQRVPGKARRLVREHVVERVGGERHRPSHVVELELTALHAQEPELQRADDAAQTGVAGEVLDQALRLGEPFELRRELIDGDEQQTVLREEGAALLLLDRAEQILLRRELLHQRRGRRLDHFRRRRIDDDDDRIELREGLFEADFALPARTGGRNQLVDIRRHREVRDRVPGGGKRQNDRGGDDPPGEMHAKANRADNKGRECFHGMIRGKPAKGPAFEASRPRQKRGTPP